MPAPPFFPSYTQCSSPGGWYKIPVAALAVLGGTAIGTLLLVGLSTAWAPGVAAFMAIVCLAAITFCTWWLNIRLICLGGDRSTIGVIYHLEPPDPTDDAFGFGSYDTDYSFNLLLWPFIPQDALPAVLDSDPWNPGNPAVVQTQLDTVLFPGLGPPLLAEISAGVNLILPQAIMVGIDGGSNLSFVGQNVEPADEATNPAPGLANQHFLQHCEIEGPGMHDLRILLWVMFAAFLVAAALSLIPVFGTVLSWILSLLAFLAFLFGGAAITHSDASPPTTGGFGGSFNAYEAGSDPSTPVDLAYCFGRWVYDSLHDGWNELHPLHFMIKIGQTTKGAIAGGNWPPGLGDTKGQLDTMFTQINSPASRKTQSAPENQWTIYPLLDGCQGIAEYPPLH